MPFKFFLIPIRHSEKAERELNAFVRGHRVLEVERWMPNRAEQATFPSRTCGQNPTWAAACW